MLLAAQLLRRRASPAVSWAVPRRWVLGITAFTAVSSVAMSASQFAMRCAASAVLDPIVRWAVYCCRIQLLRKVCPPLARASIALHVTNRRG